MIRLLSYLCLISGSLGIVNQPHRENIQEPFYQPQEMIETIRWRQPVCMIPAPGAPPCLIGDFMKRYFTAKAWEAQKSWPDPSEPMAIHDALTPRRVIGLEELEPKAIHLPEDKVKFPNYGYLRASKRSRRHHVQVGSNTPPPIRVTRVMDSPITATIVAHNCVPQIGVPFCRDYGMPSMPTKIKDKQDHLRFPLNVHPDIHHPNESNVNISRPPKGSPTAQFSPDTVSVDPINQEAAKATLAESIHSGQNTPPIAAPNDTKNDSVRPTSSGWKPPTTYELQLQHLDYEQTDNSTFAQPTYDTSDFIFESENEIVPPEQTSNHKESIKSGTGLDKPNVFTEESVNEKESTLDPEVSPAAVDQALNQFLPPQKDPVDEAITLSSTSESTLLDITVATFESTTVESISPVLETINETGEKDLSVAKVDVNNSSIDNATQTVKAINKMQMLTTLAAENKQRDTKCNGSKCDDDEKAKTDYNPQKGGFQIADNVWIVEKRSKPRKKDVIVEFTKKRADNSKRTIADGRRKCV